MTALSLVVNTVSKNRDLWPIFFDRIARYTTTNLFNKIYVFVDCPDEDIPPACHVVQFDREQTYKEQFSTCIKEVQEEYCIYISEDYILYDTVREDLISRYLDVLEANKELSFIRFMKGGLTDLLYPQFKSYEDVRELHHSFPYFYTNQAAIWRTRDLEKIHVRGPNLHIGNNDWENSFEYQATTTCRELDIRGAHCYHGEPKRGLYHYDSIVFPHVATALVKGKWNMSEYPHVMQDIVSEYDIDTAVRGQN